MRLRISEKDRKKFAELYKKYYKLMIHVANDVLHDRAAAEDAAHTACVRILEHFSGVAAVDSPRRSSARSTGYRPSFSECSRTPIEGKTGVYNLTMRRGDQVLSVYQAPCDAFVLFGSAGTVDALREELEGMTEIPTQKGRLYFGASEDGHLTALLLRDGTAVFASGNIDQKSFLKFVQNIDF